MALQIDRNYEVVVAGGGTAGIIAAIAAARTGARTLLIEQGGFLGGNAVIGLPLLGFHNNRGEQVVRGIPWELVTRLKAMGQAAEVVNVQEDSELGKGGLEFVARNVPVRPEGFKFMALEMLREAGVNILFYTVVADVVMEGQTVTGLVVENKSGRTIIAAGRFVDCTGDADIAARAGAPFEKGRDGDMRQMQPMTQLFIMSEVDLDRAEAAGAAVARKMEVIGSEEWRSRFRKHDIRLELYSAEIRQELADFVGVESGFIIRNWGDNVFYAGNMLHIARLDASDALQLSEAVQKGQNFVWRLIQFLRQHVPGFENSHLVTMFEIGIRETRRVLGEYYLTYEDVLEGRRFDDDVVLCGYWVDIHDYEGRRLTMPDKGTQVKDGGAYGIPYRCLVPRQVDGLLIAGRSLSASQEAHASARVMATSMGMGHATGTAAALSLQQGVMPRDLNYGLLQEELLAQDAYLGERFNG